jgi:hypothetical protein
MIAMVSHTHTTYFPLSCYCFKKIYFTSENSKTLLNFLHLCLKLYEFIHPSTSRKIGLNNTSHGMLSLENQPCWLFFFALL